MVSLGAALGVDVEVASPGEVDSIVAKHASSLFDRFTSSGQFKKIRRPIATAGSSGALTTATLKVADGPAAGRVWDVRNMCIMGSDDHTVVTGCVGALYVGDYTHPTLTDVKDTIPQIPFSETYSKETLTVHFGETLFVVLYNTGVSQNFVLTADVDDYADSKTAPSGL